MARAKRSFIIGSVFVCALTTLLIIVAISTNNWVESEAYGDAQADDSSINYGLFSGSFVLRMLITPTPYPMHSVLAFISVPAERCEMNLRDVVALAQGLSPGPSCTDSTVISPIPPIDNPKVLNLGIYVTVIVTLALTMIFAVISTGLSILNVFQNPKDPKYGIFGIQITCGISAVFALCTLAVWGAIWADGLSSHLAFAFIAVGELEARSPRLGFSYWLILLSIFTSIGAAALLYARQWLLEREPPPPSAAVKDDADGTIFLY